MDAPTAITFDGVTKRYYILQRATPRLGAWLADKLFEHLRREPFDALRDVSLHIPQGQLAGFLGTNGAGKSTALKLMAGITQPTSGSVRVRGRVASLLELGVGFHPDLSGMENIFYNGVIMGLSRQEILERLQSIIQFSGLEKFLYEPVRHYSSGMYARLGTSVALHLDPEIILMDEILAVGDAEFQQRGLLRIMEMHEQGVTIVLVTHAVVAAREICDRLIWLDGGTIRADGSPDEVLEMYLKKINQLSLPPEHFLSDKQRVLCKEHTDQGKYPRITSCRLENAAEEECTEIHTEEKVRFVVGVDDEGVDTPYRLALAVRWMNGQTLFEDFSDPLIASQCKPIIYEVERWPFLRANMSASFALVSASPPATVFDRAADAIQFHTASPDEHTLEGTVLLPAADWTPVR